jgi:hypothetical protein
MAKLKLLSSMLAFGLFIPCVPASPARAEAQLLAVDPLFEQWLRAAPNREREFALFSRLLTANGVADIVPAWQLLRADINNAPRCKGDAFVLPPRTLWPNIVPPLKIIRDHVIPSVGPVEARSAFRDAALNGCASGAPRSRHLNFSAIDLVASNQSSAAKTFRSLCDAWKRKGRRVNWGLGAYFDPARPNTNTDGRFHVDATGWRSWGFSQQSVSSGCTLITKANPGFRR